MTTTTTTMTAGDRAAVKILRDAYAAVLDTPPADGASDRLFHARQYLQDRDRYADVATVDHDPAGFAFLVDAEDRLRA